VAGDRWQLIEATYRKVVEASDGPLQDDALGLRVVRLECAQGVVLAEDAGAVQLVPSLRKPSPQNTMSSWETGKAAIFSSRAMAWSRNLDPAGGWDRIAIERVARGLILVQFWS
jgi:hypothetical protein